MADVYEIARAGLELAEKATPGPWISADREKDDHAYVKSLIDADDGDPIRRRAVLMSELSLMLFWPAHANNKDAEDAAVERTYANADMIAHAGTHYAALCRAVIEAEQTRLAQKAVVEAAEELEDSVDEYGYVNTAHYSACADKVCRAVRAMKERTR